jgi:hypothetical protein
MVLTRGYGCSGWKGYSFDISANVCIHSFEFLNGHEWTLFFSLSWFFVDRHSIAAERAFYTVFTL